MSMDRRDFLKGAGIIGAAGAIGTVMAGCSPSQPKAAESTSSEGGALTAESVMEKGTWSFEVAPEPITDFAETISAEVVVVGSGMSGMCCAVSAAEEGLDVIVVSAGTTAISRGGSNQAIGTKYQKEMGVDYTPKDALT